MRAEQMPGNIKAPIKPYEILEITTSTEKSRHTDTILRKLPEWFGNEAALLEYVDTVRKYPLWAAFSNGRCVGIMSGKIHYGTTGDIYVCGVDPEHFGSSLGTRLYQMAEEYFKSQGCKYVIVKTLSETNPDKNYEQTRRFYRKMGFDSLLTLTEMWDEDNHCLIMVKRI